MSPEPKRGIKRYPHLKEAEQMHGQPGSPFGCCHPIQFGQNFSFAGSAREARVGIRTELGLQGFQRVYLLQTACVCHRKSRA